MSIKIEIKSAIADSRNVTVGKGKNIGQVMAMINQEGWAFTVDQRGELAPYPTKISIGLEQGQAPYPVGFYTIAAQSIYVGDFGRLKLGRLILVPIKG